MRREAEHGQSSSSSSSSAGRAAGAAAAGAARVVWAARAAGSGEGRLAADGARRERRRWHRLRRRRAQVRPLRQSKDSDHLHVGRRLGKSRTQTSAGNSSLSLESILECVLAWSSCCSRWNAPSAYGIYIYIILDIYRVPIIKMLTLDMPLKLLGACDPNPHMCRLASRSVGVQRRHRSQDQDDATNWSGVRSSEYDPYTCTTVALE